ncbi:MAG: phenylalanine--tRNA ligase subunit alpha, partial [Halobacteriaceae archaeon]
MQLTAIQKAVLENTSATESTSIEELASIIDEQTETVTSAVFALEEKGLVSVDEEQTEQVTLTAEGNTYVENGLPELRLYRAAIEEGADEVPVGLGNVMDRASLPDDAEEIAISNFVRKEYGEIQEGELIAYSDKDPATDPEREALTTLRGGGTVDDESVISQLERRGLVQRTEHVQRYVTLTESGVTALMEGIEVTEGVDKLTPEMLATGEWQDVEFSRYNVEADATEQNSGKVHILRQTAERVKDVLTSMGFDEMEGPHIDADFWIHDCLFMPQDHPARTHWDRFGLEKPEKIDELPADLVERVENAQRHGVGPDGEGYHA